MTAQLTGGAVVCRAPGAAHAEDTAWTRAHDAARQGRLPRGHPNINTNFIAFRKTEGTTPAEFLKVSRRAR